MSKHCRVLTTKVGRVRIEAGFDRMLQGFFMNVMEVDEAREGFLYDSLVDEELFPHSGLPRSLDRYVQVLAANDLAMPPRMVEELLADQRNLTGNRIVLCGEDGEILSDAR